VWFLPNGFPYAFSDKNKQKVYTIQNASFPIPNKAVLNIINNRIGPIKKNNVDHNYLQISLGNRAHVINNDKIYDFIDISSEKTSISFSLKCGTVIHLGKGFLASKVFIEPGDTIDVILTKDIYNPTIIKGNTNSIWWSKYKKSDDEYELNNAFITEEFKSYLKLSNKVKHTTTSNIKEYDINYLTKSSFPFLYLKSYNYDFFINQYLHFYFDKKDKLIRSMGGNLNLSFKSRISNAQINYKHFFLHYYLYSILTTGWSSYFQIGKSDEEFKHFIKLCGDTLLRKSIINRLEGFNSIQPGQTIPFTHILDEHKNKIDILPANKEYALILINGINPYDENFNCLADSLPKNIQAINCSLEKTHHRFGPKDIRPDRPNNINILAHPLMFKSFSNIVNPRLASLIILYDKKGIILYSKIIHRRSSIVDKHLIVKQKSIIINTIESNRSKRDESLFSNLLNLALIVFSSLLLGFIFYKTRIRRLKRRNEQERMMQQLKLSSVQSQLNPHFLFNALNSIQNLINSNNTKKANRYLIDFSNLLRGVLKNADKPLVSLTDEINLIERYCDLEKLRLDFECTITVNTNSPAELIEIPYMLLQPLVENAIKHGLAKNKKKGELRIEISETDSILYIKIIDNGQGFEDREPENLIAKGKGLKITIDKLKSIYNEDAELTIPENTDGTGGIVQIKLKIG